MVVQERRLLILNFAGVVVGADEDDSSDSFAETDHSGVVDEGVGGSAKEEISDFEGDFVGLV